MKQIAAILGKLLIIAQNTKTWLKVIVLILVCGGTFYVGTIAFSKTKVKPCEDCGFFKTQNAELLDALIGIKKDIKEVAQNTNYIMDDMPITAMYASYDTIPKKKKQTQQQIKLGVITTKIDSIILRMQQQQQQQKSKQ